MRLIAKQKEGNSLVKSFQIGFMLFQLRHVVQVSRVLLLFEHPDRHVECGRFVRAARGNHGSPYHGRFTPVLFQLDDAAVPNASG